MEKNIFETASHLLGKKKEPKAKKTPPPAPRRGHIDRETQEMMDKIKEMQEDLKAKFDYVEQKSELLGPNVTKYLQEKNLTPAEVSFLEKAKSLLSDQLQNAVGLPPKGAIEASAPSPPTKRKGKTLGARKKWMPVK